MAKAILVMDMPDCCDFCDAFDYNSDGPRCCLTGEQKGFWSKGIYIPGRFDYTKQRMDNCPLRELPEKYVMNIPHDKDYDGEYEYGWNACIDEILSLEG